MKKSRLSVCLAAAFGACLVLSGCSFLKVQNNLTPPTLKSEEVPSEAEGLGGGEETPSDNKITTANILPVEYEYDFDAHNPNAWQKAYKKFLEEDILGQGEEGYFGVNTEEYFLADIDGTYNSDAPELCIRTGTSEADYQLLIFAYDEKKDEVATLVGPEKIFAGHTTFYQGPNGDLYAYTGHMGYLSVYHIFDLTAEQPKLEPVFTQDLNGENIDEDYKTMTEIIGDEMNPLPTFALSDDAGLIWYLNIPYPTCGSNPDQDAADEAYDKALKGDIIVYATGDRFYSGQRGKIRFPDLAKAGLDGYSNTEYNLERFCYSDVNFDGQEEMLIKLKGNSNDHDTRMLVVLSYQDGGVFAYVLPYLISSSNDLKICRYSPWKNWFSEEGGTFTGIVFDKERVTQLYGEYVPGTKAEASVKWSDFQVDYGY